MSRIPASIVDDFEPSYRELHEKLTAGFITYLHSQDQHTSIDTTVFEMDSIRRYQLDSKFRAQVNVLVACTLDVVRNWNKNVLAQHTQDILDGGWPTCLRHTIKEDTPCVYCELARDLFQLPEN